MSNNAPDTSDNGTVINIGQIIKAVMFSVVEANFGALFLNSHQYIPARTVLEEMGHGQPPTPILLHLYFQKFTVFDAPSSFVLIASMAVSFLVKFLTAYLYSFWVVGFL